MIRTSRGKLRLLFHSIQTGGDCAVVARQSMLVAVGELAGGERGKPIARNGFRLCAR
jgi:hypothetical protein